ncbi:MBL fold metallo-hydrolase [Natronomonas salina]|uniref:ComEC/Rec2 family competence protein n=1 Tax=Natronomonas salina TaxID=1710540 RepID=UPI0015B3AF6A|nr:MBL fold metallo-hydrolase [Natronomonas salina]QLD90949.1 MBL fold metallo-hydrolase [Natronomonas salina]
MRRLLAVLALCTLLATAGCTDAGIGLEPTDSTEGTETPLQTPDSTSSPDGDGDDGTGAEGELSVHYINVGQADATLLISPEGETMLIDSGDWRNDGETVIDYLEARGVDRIDHLVSTHAHADHIGGHAAVIDHFETEKDGVGAVYDSGVVHTSQTYENYLDAVERHDVTLYEVADGDEIPFPGTATTVRNPVEPGGDDLHANGVVLDVRFGETTFLFTGDAEGPVEDRLVDDYGDDLDADVYQAGHHGSETSSSASFLGAVDPEVAVVSSGYDSQYGHPHDEPLQRFAERDTRTTWTATHGTTVVVSDGSALSVRTQHDVTTDPLELRDAGEATADPSDATEERFTVGGTNDRLAPPAPAGAVAAAGG